MIFSDFEIFTVSSTSVVGARSVAYEGNSFLEAVSAASTYSREAYAGASSGISSAFSSSMMSKVAAISSGSATELA